MIGANVNRAQNVFTIFTNLTDGLLYDFTLSRVQSNRRMLALFGIGFFKSRLGGILAVP